MPEQILSFNLFLITRFKILDLHKTTDKYTDEQTDWAREQKVLSFFWIINVEDPKSA